MSASHDAKRALLVDAAYMNRAINEMTRLDFLCSASVYWERNSITDQLRFVFPDDTAIIWEDDRGPALGYSRTEVNEDNSLRYEKLCVS